jgi:hypothetical protein
MAVYTDPGKNYPVKIRPQNRFGHGKISEGAAVRRRGRSAAYFSSVFVLTAPLKMSGFAGNGRILSGTKTLAGKYPRFA